MWSPATLPVRARIEHVFVAQENAPGGRLVRTIRIVPARIKIVLRNLANSIRRVVVLDRGACRLTGGVRPLPAETSRGRKGADGADQTAQTPRNVDIRSQPVSARLILRGPLKSVLSFAMVCHGRSGA